ncbi:MAG: alpha/beta hydrolase [Phycisphaerales bacterium]|nr:alpha/beta hydrolase [Phycisphaerales bacterium]
MRRAATFLLCLTVVLHGSRAHAQPGGSLPHAPATKDAKAALPWPARLAMASGLKPETETLAGRNRLAQGTIEPVPGRVMPVHLSSLSGPTVKRGQQEDWELVRARLTTPVPDAEPRFVRPGGFVFVPAEPDDAAAAAPPPLTFRFVSARRGPADAGGKPTVVIERTWFTLYDPLPAKSEPGEAALPSPQPRGLIILLPGMFGTPGDQIAAIARRFRQEGYSVLRMLSQPSRFTESVSYLLPLEGELAATVPPIAADLSDRAAEAAYAVEAAVLYAKQERPVLIGKPRVVVGMSGGAMLLPIVLAREPGAYAGAVSIAGGVDYLKILTTSNYADWIDAVRVGWFAAAKGAQAAREGLLPPARRLAELSAVYRAAAPLDSANLVSSLTSVPWLLLHGTLDKAVPADTGDEMWELLGKPERIVIKGGHEWVFLTLSSKHKAIVDWVNNKTAPPGAGHAP